MIENSILARCRISVVFFQITKLYIIDLIPSCLPDTRAWGVGIFVFVEITLQNTENILSPKGENRRMNKSQG